MLGDGTERLQYELVANKYVVRVYLSLMFLETFECLHRRIQVFSLPSEVATDFSFTEHKLSALLPHCTFTFVGDWCCVSITFSLFFSANQNKMRQSKTAHHTLE